MATVAATTMVATISQIVSVRTRMKIGQSFSNKHYTSIDFDRNWSSNNGSNGNISFNYGGNNGGGNKNFNDRGGNFGRNNNNFGNNNSNGGGNFGNNDFMDNNDRMNNTVSPYAVHLRGMPYDCYEEEIHRFFSPLKLVGCQVLFNNTGKVIQFYFTKCVN